MLLKTSRTVSSAGGTVSQSCLRKFSNFERCVCYCSECYTLTFLVRRSLAGHIAQIVIYCRIGNHPCRKK